MQKSDGFSLIELVIAVTVLATLMTLAIPAYRSFVLNNQRAAAVTDLMTSLQYARSEAISRGQMVGLCHTSTPMAANACGGGTGWENGWIVFIYSGDANNNDLVEAGEIATVLRVREALPQGVTLRGSANAVARVVFQPSGTTLQEPSDGVLTYCDVRGFGSQARRILINPLGRAQLETPSGAGSCT